MFCWFCSQRLQRTQRHGVKRLLCQKWANKRRRLSLSLPHVRGNKQWHFQDFGPWRSQTNESNFHMRNPNRCSKQISFVMNKERGVNFPDCLHKPLLNASEWRSSPRSDCQISPSFAHFQKPITKSPQNFKGDTKYGAPEAT